MLLWFLGVFFFLFLSLSFSFFNVLSKSKLIKFLEFAMSFFSFHVTHEYYGR